MAGCHRNARPETADGDHHRLPPVAVADAGFARAVHKLMRDGKASAERSSLLAGTIRRQLAHASEHFERGDTLRGSAAVVGALYLAGVCVLPELLQSYARVSFYFGGTSLLIAVSVTMDTVAQIQSHLLAHQYEGLTKKAKLRGATRRI